MISVCGKETRLDHWIYHGKNRLADKSLYWFSCPHCHSTKTLDHKMFMQEYFEIFRSAPPESELEQAQEDTQSCDQLETHLES